MKFLEPMMEVYAAMVDRLDQNIGRLVEHLEQRKQLDNTLILFMPDNGACPYQRLRNGVLVPGPANRDIAYDARWANMRNTPLIELSGAKYPAEVGGHSIHVMDEPGRVKKLAGMYDAWAQRTGARKHEVAQTLKPSKQSQLFDLGELLAKPGAD